MKGKRRGEGFHRHLETGGVSIHRFYKNDKIQGKTKYYNIEGILWMYDISNENRIIDRVQLYQLDKVTEKVIL